MSKFPGDLKYSKDHEWVRVEGTQATIGITDYAERQLGEVVFIELPNVGANFNQADEIGTIESVKAVAEIYAPISGEVVEINGAAHDDPENVNDDPYGEGWLVKFRIKDTAELKGLLSADQYEKYIAEEKA